MFRKMITRRWKKWKNFIKNLERKRIYSKSFSSLSVNGPNMKEKVENVMSTVMFSVV